MDKARPFGVVFADRHAQQLMTPEVAILFTNDKVCIRGISEQEPMPILITRGVEIAAYDREPIPEARHAWGDEGTVSASEVRDSSSRAFNLPRAPRSYERVGVHVEFPLFDKDGRRKETVSWFEVYGEYVEQPGGPLVQIDLKTVKDHINQLPATTTGKILGLTKTTYVTFTPFCEPIDET
jgi:hypothetical protein